MILFDKKKLLLAENASSNLTERFLAVGSRYILSSEDGVTVTQINKIAAIKKLYCIKNKFFGFADSGKILSSKDGINWTDHGENQILSSVAGLGEFYTFGNRVYLYGSYTNLPTVASYNGLDWDIISDTSMNRFYSPVLYKNNFVAIKSPEGKSLISSSDFVNWNNIGGVADPSSGENEFISIICSDGNKVYVHTSTNRIYSSSDLVNWELVTQLTDKFFSPSVAMSNGKNIIFAGIGIGTQLPVCCFSNDGINWNTVYCKDSTSSPILFGGCCSKGFWISSKYSPVLFSEDGSSWEWAYYDGNNEIYNIVAGSVGL